MRKFNQLNRLLMNKPPSKGGSSSTVQDWLLSYADVVTILLCFFMIFYAGEKEREKIDDKFLIKLQKDYINKLGGVSKGSSAYNAFEKVEKISEGLEKNLGIKDGVKVKNHISFLVVQFENIGFFQKGETSMTSSGVNQISQVAEVLEPYKNDIYINVIGHADPTPVSPRKKDRWWRTNIELSVARALAVLQYFSENNFPKENVFVSGVGESLSHRFIPEDANSYQFARTITLRIEPRDRKNEN